MKHFVCELPQEIVLTMHEASYYSQFLVLLEFVKQLIILVLLVETQIRSSLPMISMQKKDEGRLQGMSSFDVMEESLIYLNILSKVTIRNTSQHVMRKFETNNYHFAMLCPCSDHRWAMEMKLGQVEFRFVVE